MLFSVSIAEDQKVFKHLGRTLHVVSPPTAYLVLLLKTHISLSNLSIKHFLIENQWLFEKIYRMVKSRLFNGKPLLFIAFWRFLTSCRKSTLSVCNYFYLCVCWLKW